MSNVVQFPRPQTGQAVTLQVPLEGDPQQTVAIAVDAEDLPRIMAAKGKLRFAQCGYARFTSRPALDREFYLHRWLQSFDGRKLPKKVWVDHIDRNTTNNCKSNLRLVTPAMNNQNRSVPLVRAESGQAGVYRHRNKWQVRVSGKSYGVYADCEQAKEVARKIIAAREQEILDRIAGMQADRLAA